jgi:predicted HTH transcriptional regulator
MQKATQPYTNEHNQNLVLKTILEGDSISRAEIVRTTGLTRTTIQCRISNTSHPGLAKEIQLPR